MKTRVLLIAVFVLNVSTIRAGQLVKQESLLDRARRGDDSALSDMEKADDIQDLRTLVVRDPGFRDPGYGGRSAARLSLARLGDSATLQYYACRSLTRSVSQIPELMRQDFDYIGGDFTVQVYRHLLDSDPGFRPQIEGIMKTAREKGGDSWPQLPSTLALLRLPKLVPSSSIPEISALELQANPQKAEELKAKWRAWIDGHQQDLQQLKPTAQGVSFNPADCSAQNR